MRDPRPALFAILLGCLVFGGAPRTARATDWTAHELAAIPTAMVPAIDFLATSPVIDGRLDAGLTGLPARTFSVAYASRPDNPVPAAEYRLAYGADFLYAYVSVAAERLVCRDRAYQNGDGFQLVIARPQPNDAPSREFYVIACSAVGNLSQEWSRRIIWYYNVDGLFRPLSEEAQLECRNEDGRTSFELLLPWSDLTPYHPWLDDAIGLNLCLVKAIGDGEQDQYFIRPDDHIQQEQCPREYVRAAFAPPVLPPDAPARTFVQLAAAHVAAGTAVTATAVTARGAAGDQRLDLSVLAGEGTRVRRTTLTYACTPGLTRHSFAVPADDLPPGGYRVEWRDTGGGVRGSGGLSLLPPDDPSALLVRLDAAKPGRAGAGTLATLRLRLQELTARLAATLPYETLADYRLDLEATLADLRAVEAGADPLALRTGFQRRGFVSAVDSTLQPYAVLVPEGYDPARRWPLLVYLHGSGVDENSFRRSLDLVPDGFLAIAPRGRGTSNAYTADHAQQDIAEAITDACANYAVDPSRIVLAGFSMGGYGVYRTQWETPKKFRALVVLSGHPDIGNRYLGRDDQPDFRQPRYLEPFRGVPMFIFHGGQDRNCPYALTEEVVAKLRDAGAAVTFVSEADKGHSMMNAANLAKLRAWLAAQVGGIAGAP